MTDRWKTVGGIWERKTRKNDDMLSIMINDIPYIAFRNKRKKEGGRNPDWEVFESKPMEKQPEPKREPGDEEVTF